MSCCNCQEIKKLLESSEKRLVELEKRLEELENKPNGPILFRGVN